MKEEPNRECSLYAAAGSVGSLLSHAYTYVEPEKIEDAVSTAMAKMLERNFECVFRVGKEGPCSGCLLPRDALERLLYKIAKDGIKDLLKRKKLVVPLAEGYDVAAEDNAARRENAEALRAALERLSPTYREVMHLELKGCSRREIAEILGLPIKTVHTRFRRGYTLLRALLSEDDPDRKKLSDG